MCGTGVRARMWQGWAAPECSRRRVHFWTGDPKLIQGPLSMRCSDATQTSTPSMPPSLTMPIISILVHVCVVAGAIRHRESFPGAAADQLPVRLLRGGLGCVCVFGGERRAAAASFMLVVHPRTSLRPNQADSHPTTTVTLLPTAKRKTDKPKLDTATLFPCCSSLSL